MPSEEQDQPCWLLDLDGVLWLGEKPIPHAADAVNELRERGYRVAFYTNNSFSSRQVLLDKFASHGIEGLDPNLVFSSGETAAGLCQAGERAYVLGGEGIKEALARIGVTVVSDQQVDTSEVQVVIVGLDPSFDYRRLSRACDAIWKGARLIGTNEDATYPMASGPSPGGGALVAAVAYASGAKALIAGKPYPPTVELLQARLGHIDVMIGDRPSTDGVLAKRLGARFGLVRSGVTALDQRDIDPSPDFDAPDLASLVQSVAH